MKNGKKDYNIITSFLTYFKLILKRLLILILLFIYFLK